MRHISSSNKMTWISSKPCGRCQEVKYDRAGYKQEVRKTHNQSSGELQPIILRSCERCPKAESYCMRFGSWGWSLPLGIGLPGCFNFSHFISLLLHIQICWLIKAPRSFAISLRSAQKRSLLFPGVCTAASFLPFRSHLTVMSSEGPSLTIQPEAATRTSLPHPAI